MAGGALLTADDAAHKLEVAIEAGDIWVQQAPGGHPLFAAIETARERLTWLRDSYGILPPMAPGTRIRTLIEKTIDDVYAAMASLKNDPDHIPETTWPTQIAALPWGWIAGGVGAVVLVALIFNEGQRR